MELTTDQWIVAGVAASLVVGIVTLAVLLWAVSRAKDGAGESSEGSGWLLRIQREPVIVRTAILAIIAVGASFGLSVSVEQQAAIVAASLAILAVFAKSTRDKVTPVAAPNLDK